MEESAKEVNERFDGYMQRKGFSGRIAFNHSDHRLHVITQTDNLDTNTRSVDIRQCSGGERSFTSFCLLLALDSVVSI